MQPLRPHRWWIVLEAAQKDSLVVAQYAAFTVREALSEEITRVYTNTG